MGPFKHYITPGVGGAAIVIFVTNCYEGLEGARVKALSLCSRDLLKRISSCNCTKVELKI